MACAHNSLTDTIDPETDSLLLELLDHIHSAPKLPVYSRTLPLQTRRSPKLTVVLDLDETLVHTEIRPVSSPDLIIEMPFNESTCKLYVKYRPGLVEFLKLASQVFELVVFTASERIYAHHVLEALDPQNTMIRHRLYRDSCVEVKGNYIKDLRVLGRDLSQVVIVDNSIVAFAMNLENGIPISSWYNDHNDTALCKLLAVLVELSGFDDVRKWIKQTFNLAPYIR